MKIVIVLPDDGLGPGVAEDQVKGVLLDAIAEFTKSRVPPAAYVEKRYRGNPHLCTPAKVAEVAGRVDLAWKLHRGEVSVEASDLAPTTRTTVVRGGSLADMRNGFAPAPVTVDGVETGRIVREWGTLFYEAAHGFAPYGPAISTHGVTGWQTFAAATKAVVEAGDQGILSARREPGSQAALPDLPLPGGWPHPWIVAIQNVAPASVKVNGVETGYIVRKGDGDDPEFFYDPNRGFTPCWIPMGTQGCSGWKSFAEAFDVVTKAGRAGKLSVRP